MPTADHVLRRPWMEPMVHGLREGFAWDERFLRPLRARYAILYWNPRAGAAVQTAGRRHLLDARRLLLIPPGCLFRRENIAPFDHWWCHLRVRAAADAVCMVPVRGDLRDLLQRIWDGCRSGDAGSPATLAAVHAVAGLAIAQADWRTEDDAWPDPRLSGLADWLSVRGYPGVPNRALAARLGMHEKSFSRLFRRIVGRPAQGWLRERRLDLAADRLESGMDVEAAAVAGGFADRYHFGRLFRRRHGVGPGAYRRAHAPATSGHAG